MELPPCLNHATVFICGMFHISVSRLNDLGMTSFEAKQSTSRRQNIMIFCAGQKPVYDRTVSVIYDKHQKHLYEIYPLPLLLI